MQQEIRPATALASIVLVFTVLSGCVVNSPQGSSGERYRDASRHNARAAQVAPDDATLASLVKGRLSKHLSKASANITVAVSGGIVQLSGTVDGDRQRDEAGKIASKVDGVRGVQNNLTTEADARRTANQQKKEEKKAEKQQKKEDKKARKQQQQ